MRGQIISVYLPLKFEFFGPNVLHFFFDTWAWRKPAAIAKVIDENFCSCSDPNKYASCLNRKAGGTVPSPRLFHVETPDSSANTNP